jgi:hypothetical protein
MSHKAQEYFVKMLEDARKKVAVGEKYIHSKSGGEYTVLDLAIIETTEEIGVVYQAEYGEKLKWLRTLGNFTEVVEIDGRKVSRFVREKQK